MSALLLRFLSKGTLDALQGAESMKNIFERYNICTVDLGDGEIAAAYLKPKDNRYEVHDLWLSNSKNTIPNILFFGEKSDGSLSDKAELVESGNLERLAENGCIFCNFKSPLWEETIQENGGRQTGQNIQSMKRGELLAHSFACTLQRLFQNNEVLQNNPPKGIEKETIILVGRPSSQTWADKEKDYADLLASKLRRYLQDEIAERIHILVMAESSAAMAGAVKLEPKEWQNGMNIILDLGSSTFDMTVVLPEGIPNPGGEQSVYFGGNQADKAIQNYGNYLFSEKYPNEVPPRQPGRTAQMRFMKETLYGPGGKDLELTPPCYKYYPSELKETFNYNIDHNNVTTALVRKDQLPELTCATVYEDGEKDTASWLEVCEDVMKSFWGNAQELNVQRKLNVRLILTGGVSNMPEVREMAKDVFGVEPQLTAHPSHTVSRGMGAILGSELEKLRLLQHLKNEISISLPDVETLQRKAAQVCAKNYMQYIDKNMTVWSAVGEQKSLNELIQQVGNENNHYAALVADCGNQIIREWFELKNLSSKIEALLGETFKNMFPNFQQKFPTTVKIPTFNDIELELPEMNLCYFFDEEKILAFFRADDIEDAIKQELKRKRAEKERADIMKVFQANRKQLLNGTITVDGLEMVGGSGTPNAEQWFYDQFKNTAGDHLYRSVEKELDTAIEAFVEELTYYLAVK